MEPVVSNIRRIKGIIFGIYFCFSSENSPGRLFKLQLFNESNYRVSKAAKSKNCILAGLYNLFFVKLGNVHRIFFSFHGRFQNVIPYFHSLLFVEHFFIFLAGIFLIKDLM